MGDIIKIETKVALKTLKQLRIAGSIADLVKARKEHRCCVCPEPIMVGEEHYCIYKGGGGLGSLKFPDRVHEGCLDEYFNRRGK